MVVGLRMALCYGNVVMQVWGAYTVQVQVEWVLFVLEWALQEEKGPWGIDDPGGREHQTIILWWKITITIFDYKLYYPHLILMQGK